MTLSRIKSRTLSAPNDGATPGLPIGILIHSLKSMARMRHQVLPPHVNSWKRKGMSTAKRNVSFLKD